jgi:hypothetical protein
MATQNLLIPQTYVWSVDDLDVNSIAFKEVIVRLHENVNQIATATNQKDIAFYGLTEAINGQTYFATTTTSRSVYRKVINFGALPNTGTKSVAHDIAIETTFIFTRIYGCSSDPVNKKYIPLPYASATNDIELNVNATNVNIITISNMSAYTTTYIVLEYTKY